MADTSLVDVATPSLTAATIPSSPDPATTGWSVRWVVGREIFTSPDGVEYVRASSGSAELEIAMRTPGIPPLRLRRESSEAIIRRRTRAERRLERRTARLRRSSRSDGA